MRQKLIDAINDRFRDAPAGEATADLKEQTLAAALSRFDIDVLEGSSEQEAYTAALKDADARIAAAKRGAGRPAPAAPAAPQIAQGTSSPTPKKEKSGLLRWGVVAAVIVLIVVIVLFVAVRYIVGTVFGLSSPKPGGFGETARYSAADDRSLTDIRELEINWVGGSVTLVPGSTLSFSEDYAGSGRYALTYSVSGHKLTIDACEGSLFSSAGLPPKDLTVTVPDGLASLDVNVVSASVDANDVADITSVDISTVSGSVFFRGSAELVSAETVSGSVDFFFDRAPEAVILDSVSGSMSVTLPAGTDCSVSWDSVSGSLNDGSPAGGSGRSCSIEGSSVSGSLTVLTENS